MRGVFLIIFLLILSSVNAQERSFSTTLGLGYGYSIPFGTFKSQSISDFESGFALNSPIGIKFFVEQNIGKYVGASFSVYALSHDLDLTSYEQSFALNNRGIVPDAGFSYKVTDNDSWWMVGIANIGAYYRRMIGTKDNLELKLIGAITWIDMDSPSFNVDVIDSTGSVIDQQLFESFKSWREPSLIPSIHGFSIELNVKYHFYKNFAVNPSIYFTRSIGRYEGNEKALINLSRIDYVAMNLSIGLSYTFFNRKKNN